MRIAECGMNRQGREPGDEHRAFSAERRGKRSEAAGSLLSRGAEGPRGWGAETGKRGNGDTSTRRRGDKGKREEAVELEGAGDDPEEERALPRAQHLHGLESA